MYPERVTQPLLERVNRTHHPKRIQQRTKREHDRQRRQICAFRQVPYSGSHRIDCQFRRGHTADDPDVVVWTCLHTVETEVAIEISGLTRLKQRQFTTALNHDQRCGRFTHTANTVFCRAVSANVMVANGDLEWRSSRSDEVKLSDRANKLAERRVFEDGINHERG